jgi:hypothetical protein
MCDVPWEAGLGCAHRQSAGCPFRQLKTVRKSSGKRPSAQSPSDTCAPLRNAVMGRAVNIIFQNFTSQSVLRERCGRSLGL